MYFLQGDYYSRVDNADVLTQRMSVWWGGFRLLISIKLFTIYSYEECYEEIL